MQLTLTAEETRLLLDNLGKRIEHMDAELIHTDKHELQHALAVELQQLRALADRIRKS
jgi:5-bromo-4-chloroindolyl phosphate hydrolysis protein